MPTAGDQYVWDNPDGKGYGEMHLGEVLTAEMTELDIKNGQIVTFMQDDDEGWHLVEWIDDHGIDRITAIEPGVFDANFASS